MVPPTPIGAHVLVKLAGTDTVIGYLGPPSRAGANIAIAATASTATLFEKEDPAIADGTFNLHDIVCVLFGHDRLHQI